MPAPRYSEDPRDPRAFTHRFDGIYTVSARLYDVAVRRLPVWRSWLSRVLPEIAGERVLEVSFGTGYLLTRVPAAVEVHGIDYNEKMVEVARRNLERSGRRAWLCRGDVAALPYLDASFDCVVNTMALSGYPDAGRALAEMHRMLRPGGRLVLIDVGFPTDGNLAGWMLARFWQWSGDVVRDTAKLLVAAGFVVERKEIGGFGSVALYVAIRE